MMLEVIVKINDVNCIIRTNSNWDCHAGMINAKFESHYCGDIDLTMQATSETEINYHLMDMFPLWNEFFYWYTFVL